MSSATRCTSAESSKLTMLTLMPVSFSNGARLAAIAAVGAVFSEMKLMRVPSNRRHTSSPAPSFGIGWESSPHAPSIPSAPSARPLRSSVRRDVTSPPVDAPVVSSDSSPRTSSSGLPR